MIYYYSSSCSTCFPGLRLYYIYLQILHKTLLSQRLLTDYMIYSKSRAVIYLYMRCGRFHRSDRSVNVPNGRAGCRSISITWFRRKIMTLAYYIYTKHPNSWPGQPAFHTRCKNKRRPDNFSFTCHLTSWGGGPPHDLDISGKIGVGP